MSKRRLAAIMFSDIVGYSALLEQDEKKAFNTRKKNQRIHRRLIKKFNGRWLKEMAGGILASFNSNIDAVICAVSIRKATEEIETPVRIGIHLGDVIFEKKDVLGDGVNIASRIHNTVKTNDIVISETVYNDIKNKEGLEIEFLGEQALKGVSKPVGIYKVACEDESLLDFTIDTGELSRPFIYRRTSLVAGIIVIALLAFALYYFLPKSTQSSSKLGRSVLIMPFDNFLGTDTLDYFVAGMHNELINDIGMIGALNVKSKTTANAIKKTNKSNPEIAKEFGINTFVEGAVLCIGDSVCLQVKLLDQDENEVWIHDFEVERSQILNLYNTIAKEISSELGVILTSNQERLLSRSRTVDREAYDAYMKFSQTRNYSFESLNKEREFLESAIEKDPDWAPLYAMSVSNWLALQLFGWVSPSVATPKIYENLNKALELDPDLPSAHFFNATIAWWMEWDWAKAEKGFLKTLAINPNYSEARIFYAQLLLTLQRTEEALSQGQLAYDLDQLNPTRKIEYGLLLNMTGDCETALALGEEVFAADSEHFAATGLIIYAAFECGDYDKVIEAWLHYMQIIGEIQFEDDTFKEIERIYDEQGFLAAEEEIAHQLEVFAENNSITPADLATAYIYANQPDKAMDWLEKAYEIHDPQMIFLGKNPYYNKLKDNPRYIALLKKMNLPLP